jgi:hypothetical protein
MSEPSTYDIHAPQLLARGFFPLSIGPGTKKPQHFVPSLSAFHDTTGWTQPQRRPETSPQPGAGIGVRLGRQADGVYVVALDWDNDDAAIAAMDAFPPTVTKEGQRGFTAFYKASGSVPTRDFRLDGRVVVQVLSDGRQTVVSALLVGEHVFGLPDNHRQPNLGPTMAPVLRSPSTSSSSTAAALDLLIALAYVWIAGILLVAGFLHFSLLCH